MAKEIVRRAFGVLILWAVPLFSCLVWWQLPAFTLPSFVAEMAMDAMLFGGGWLAFGAGKAD